MIKQILREEMKILQQEKTIQAAARVAVPAAAREETQAVVRAAAREVVPAEVREAPGEFQHQERAVFRQLLCKVRLLQKI